MKLAVAETFYSIQGEGRYSGVPAVFLRLAGCNLLCGGVGTDKDGQFHDGATWRCDTIEVWRKGRAVDVNDLVARWQDDGTLDHLRKGAHLIITGGEPLLQQKALVLFVDLLLPLVPYQFFIEVETNGTVMPMLNERGIIRFNCSPKLSNSGMPASMRKLVKLPIWTDFKFVISREQDLEEVLAIVNDHCITPCNVFLMPATDNREALISTSKMVAEACKKHYFNFSSRHQVMIWDRTTGV